MKAATPEAASAIPSSTGTSRTPSRIAARAAATPGQPGQGQVDGQHPEDFPVRCSRSGTVSGPLGRLGGDAGAEDERSAAGRGGRRVRAPLLPARVRGSVRAQRALARVLRPRRRRDRPRPRSRPRSSTPAARWASWSRRCASAASTPGASTSPSTRSPRSTSRSADHCRVASITEPLPRRYDLIACIEVLEHLPPAETDAGDRQPLRRHRPAAALDHARRLRRGDPPQRAARRRPGRRCSPAKASSATSTRDLSYLTPWAALYTRGRGAAGRDRAPLRPRLVAAAPRGRRGARSRCWQSQEQLAELEAGGGSRTGRSCCASSTPRGGDPAAARPADRQGRRTRRRPGPARRAGRALARRRAGRRRTAGCSRVIPRRARCSRAGSRRLRGRRAERGGRTPRFSILTPVYETPADVLRGDAATRSAARASATGSCAWSTTRSPAAARAARSLDAARARDDPRIRVCRRERERRHRRRLQRRPGDGRGRVRRPARPRRQAPPRRARAASTRRSRADPEVDYVYTDEDKIDARRAPLGPVLQARLVAGADADPDVHLPPQRPAPLAGRGGRRLRPRVRGLPGLGPGPAR